MDAADAAGVKVMVCQNDRFRSGADTLAALAAGGSLGQPYFGLMTRFGNRPGVKHSGEDDHAYLWERGIHDLDTICHIFSSTPAKIFCDSFNPPWSPYKGVRYPPHSARSRVARAQAPTPKQATRTADADEQPGQLTASRQRRVKLTAVGVVAREVA